MRYVHAVLNDDYDNVDDRFYESEEKAELIAAYYNAHSENRERDEFAKKLAKWKEDIVLRKRYEDADLPIPSELKWLGSIPPEPPRKFGRRSYFVESYELH